jgi:hypothetical protein
MKKALTLFLFFAIVALAGFCAGYQAWDVYAQVGHTEHGKGKIGPDGTFNGHFKVFFHNEHLICTVTKGTGQVRSNSRESVEIIGKPGTKVEWACQDKVEH